MDEDEVQDHANGQQSSYKLRLRRSCAKQPQSRSLEVTDKAKCLQKIPRKRKVPTSEDDPSCSDAEGVEDVLEQQKKVLHYLCLVIQAMEKHVIEPVGYQSAPERFFQRGVLQTEAGSSNGLGAKRLAKLKAPLIVRGAGRPKQALAGMETCLC